MEIRHLELIVWLLSFAALLVVLVLNVLTFRKGQAFIREARATLERSKELYAEGERRLEAAKRAADRMMGNIEAIGVAKPTKPILDEPTSLPIAFLPMVGFEQFCATRRWSENLKDEDFGDTVVGDHPTVPGFIYYDTLFIEQVTKDWPETAQAQGEWYLILGNAEYISRDLPLLERKLYGWAEGDSFHGLTTSSSHFEATSKEFPDYDVTTLPALPWGFINTSWHHDTCPTWKECRRIGDRPTDLMIVADYPHTLDREDPGSKRFGLHMSDQTNNWSCIYSTDSGSELPFVVAFARYVRVLGLGFHVDNTGASYTHHPEHTRSTAGGRLYNDAEALTYDYVMDAVIGFTDPYELGLAIWRVMGLIPPEKVTS